VERNPDSSEEESSVRTQHLATLPSIRFEIPGKSFLSLFSQLYNVLGRSCWPVERVLRDWDFLDREEERS
jgi:hypothetical protein